MKQVTLISVFWWWLWLQCIGDNPCVQVITPGDLSCTGNDSDICMLVMTLIYWYWCWLLSVYCWWIWYLSTNIPLISAYWWWLWHQYTADDSDICPLVKTLITVYWWWLWHLTPVSLPREATYLPTSFRILKYILYICSLLTIENAPLAGNLTW